MTLWCGVLFGFFALLVRDFKPELGVETYFIVLALFPLAGLSSLAIWTGFSAFRLCRGDWQMRTLLAGMKTDRPSFISLVLIDSVMFGFALLAWGAVGWFWLRMAAPLAWFLIDGLLYHLLGA